MKNQDEWGPWITHDGKGCPCVGQYVNSVSKNNEERFHIAHGLVIKGYGAGVDCWVALECICAGEPSFAVVRYRIRKPLGLIMLEAIARDTTTPIVRVNA